MLTGSELLLLAAAWLVTHFKRLPLDPVVGQTVRSFGEFWMAPDYQWLPVRLRFTDTNDEVWDSVLAALPGQEPPPDPTEPQIKP